MEERNHQGSVAALQRRDPGRPLPGILRGRDADQPVADPGAPADRRRRLRRRPDRAWVGRRAGRGNRRPLPRQLKGASVAVTPKSDLAARAAAVIPGGVNSGQRRIEGLDELVIASTSGATFTDGDGNTYT